MNNQSTKKSWWKSTSDVLLPILIAMVFFAFTFSFYPFREKLQYDTDEGLNLMRSMLVEMGHPLYTEVSSDQPPLFNQILALVFRVVGWEVNAARLLVLLFSTLLVWACAQFLQLTWGRLSAILFLPLIIMTPRYLGLSVAVMIGVPCIALAAVSLVLVTFWHQDRRDLWLVLSGFLLAFSVLIKFFTGFLVPIFLVGITLSAYHDHKGEKFSWRILRPALVWSSCFAGLAILLTLMMVGPGNLWLIIYPHLMAPSQELFQLEGYSINVHLQAAVPLLLLALPGALIAIFKRNWLGLYPLAWALAAYLLFSFYSPVFYHHQLLITVPAAMLSAPAVAEGILSLVHVRRFSDLAHVSALLGVIALIGFVWLPFHYSKALNDELTDLPRISGFTLKATPGKLKILHAMEKYADKTNWILTDMPMYAFRVGRPVPPNLATFSQKRVSTGSLTEKDVLDSMREYRPEQVLMARFEFPGLEDYLKENYTRIESAEAFRLFLRNDLVPATQ
jgi:4-amino-4-deoxy-L-arabinose transferase-like glycosyltransferase